MKKLLSIVICASAVAAYGTDPDPVTLGTVGVTKVANCTTTNTIIAVSFADLAGGDITASNIVKTTNLTYGDTLKVYDAANGNFKVFTLDGEEPPHFWRETLTQNLGGGETSENPGTTTLGAGVGLWLVRGGAWDGSPFDIYLYGAVTASYPQSGSAESIAADTAKLFGNPLQSDAMPVITGQRDGDRIIIATNNVSGTLVYTWKEANNAWGSGFGAKRKTLSAIPKGTGFWYAPNGSGAARTLYWAAP